MMENLSYVEVLDAHNLALQMENLSYVEVLDAHNRALQTEFLKALRNHDYIIAQAIAFCLAELRAQRIEL